MRSLSRTKPTAAVLRALWRDRPLHGDASWLFEVRRDGYVLNVHVIVVHDPTDYTYRGDRLTDPRFRFAHCNAVRDARGKCIRGRNGNMLVRFVRGPVAVVLGRQLRKVER